MFSDHGPRWASLSCILSFWTVGLSLCAPHSRVLRAACPRGPRSVGDGFDVWVLSCPRCRPCPCSPGPHVSLRRVATSQGRSLLLFLTQATGETDSLSVPLCPPSGPPGSDCCGAGAPGLRAAPPPTDACPPGAPARVCPAARSAPRAAEERWGVRGALLFLVVRPVRVPKSHSWISESVSLRVCSCRVKTS